MIVMGDALALLALVAGAEELDDDEHALTNRLTMPRARASKLEADLRNLRFAMGYPFPLLKNSSAGPKSSD
jgi:hypothetical protein